MARTFGSICGTSHASCSGSITLCNREPAQAAMTASAKFPPRPKVITLEICSAVTAKSVRDTALCRLVSRRRLRISAAAMPRRIEPTCMRAALLSEFDREIELLAVPEAIQQSLFGPVPASGQAVPFHPELCASGGD